MKQLRYGIIGGGFVAAFHMRAMCQMRGIEVAGIFTRVPTERKNELVAYAREHELGEAQIYSSIKEMVPNVDVVAIFGNNYDRVAYVEEIVEAVTAGSQLKGVICEKPLGRNLAEARRMVELTKKVNLNTAYFENQLHMNAMQTQRRQLAPLIKTMGPLTLVRSGEEHGGAHNGWFWDPVKAGGGVLSDMGCHCLSVGWYALTPPDKPIHFLQPVSVSCDISLLKWGQPRSIQKLKEMYDIDFSKAPAEDFSTGIVTYKNPDTGQLTKAQFTVSWMFDMQGLRICLDGIGPGYSFEINTLKSPLQVFISDAAASSLTDTEMALEKQQSSRGLLTVQPNEPDLYGYTSENVDALNAFRQGRPALADWEYGAQIVRLTMAGYMSAERGSVIDLTEPAISKDLETYVPLVAQGRGAEMFPSQINY